MFVIDSILFPGIMRDTFKVRWLSWPEEEDTIEPAVALRDQEGAHLALHEYTSFTRVYRAYTTEINAEARLHMPPFSVPTPSYYLSMARCRSPDHAFWLGTVVTMADRVAWEGIITPLEQTVHESRRLLQMAMDMLEPVRAATRKRKPEEQAEAGRSQQRALSQ